MSTELISENVVDGAVNGPELLCSPMLDQELVAEVGADVSALET